MNNFYNALALVSIFHRRVAGLYLIVELEKEHYIEFADSNDTEGQAKDHSIFRITLTKYPTEKDRSSVGFNEAFKAEDITNPIDGYLIIKVDSFRTNKEREIKIKKRENLEIKTKFRDNHAREKIESLDRIDKKDKEIKSLNKQKRDSTINNQGEITGTSTEIDQKDKKDQKDQKDKKDKIGRKDKIGQKGMIDKEELKEKKINTRTELEEITETESKTEETIEKMIEETTNKNMNLIKDTNQKKRKEEITEKEITKNLINKKITKSNCFMI